MMTSTRTRIANALMVLALSFAWMAPAHAAPRSTSDEVHELHLHAAEAIATNATFQWLDGQQYWQSNNSSGQVLFPISLEAGDRILLIEVFLENTVSAHQTVAARRKDMDSTASVLLDAKASPSTAGNHTVGLNMVETIAGNNQWYVRISMGSLPGNRVRGARITYDHPQPPASH